MMEALLLIGVFAFACAIVVYAIKYFMNKRLEKLQEEEAEHRRQLDATRKWREGLNARMAASGSTVPPRGYETTKTYTPTKQSFAPSPTQSVQSHDDSSNFIANMLIMDALTRHHNEPTIRVSDTPVKDTSPSWGFDDSDSRKSISSSMDTSSSWSSSSSDSFSSSDSSGPSSDW